MAGSHTWFGWLAGLVSGLRAPAPGTHEAMLEQHRVGALLNKELRKPAGQRDEELFHALNVEYRSSQLKNMKAQVASTARNADVFASTATLFEHPFSRRCCAAGGWVRQRVAASYRALHDYYSQNVLQITEELAAAEARRPALIVAQPTLHLNLSEALQQPPPRLDMCRVCAGWIEQMELAEETCRVDAEFLVGQFKKRGMQPAPAVSTASEGAAAAAAEAPADEVLQGEQQQQQQQQQQQAKQCSGATGGASNEEAVSATPKRVQAPASSATPTQSRQQLSGGRRPTRPPNAAALASQPTGLASELRGLLAADAQLAIDHRAANDARRQQVDQLLAESAALEASMEAKAQEWGQAWQAVQSELETLHEPPPLPAAAAAGSPEQPPSWVGPLVAAWTYLADSLHNQARGQHTLADWLASRVLPLSTLRLAWSAWLARLGVLPAAEQ